MGALWHQDLAPGVEPVMLGDDYSDTIRVRRPSGVYYVTVTPLQPPTIDG